MASQNDYHLLELSIAQQPGDQRRIMPVISANHRKILDVGCGAGQTLIASNLASEVVAVGADLDHEALKLGSTLCPRVRFVRAKGEALSFADECFDLVISRVALPYMHIPRALEEFFRVLRVGGDLWVVLHPFSMLREDLADSLSRLKPKAVLHQLYCLTNGLTLHVMNKQFRFPLAGGGFESFQTNIGISRALCAAGFSEIQISRDRFFVVTARKTTQKLAAAASRSKGIAAERSS